MGFCSCLDSQRRTVHSQRAAGSRATRWCLAAMLTASLCAGVMLLWAIAAPCKCEKRSSAEDSNTDSKASTGSSSPELPGSAQDRGDTRIGARVMGGKLALPLPERLVVAARYREDILWMHEQLADLPYLVYQDGDPSAPLKVAAGPPATEAKAYLQFILDNYDRLPNITVFIHAHRESWHFDDTADRLIRLRWEAAPFANLRFKEMAGGLPGVHLNPREPQRAWDEGCRNTSAAFQVLWQEVLTHYMNQVMPAEVFAPCCGQFMVARERITTRPREMYANLLEWLLTSSLPPYWTGRSVEYAWHIIFGEPVKIQALDEHDLYTPIDPARDSTRRMLASKRVRVGAT